MGTIFWGNEVVRLAIEIEKNGEKFYGSLAESAKSQGVRELSSYLAGEERKHREIFEKLLDTIEEYVPFETYPGEYHSYLRALAEERVFTGDAGVERALREAGTDVEAIEVAIGFEKDSILLFHEMMNIVREKDHPVIQRLIDEERSHLMKLRDMKDNIES